MKAVAPPVLDRFRPTIEPALRAAVEGLHPDLVRVCGYHVGWWDREGTETPTGGGKAVRPALALLAAEAAGGSVERGVPAAVAVELIHNFSLLHDDVMDGDLERRHRPTAWVAFGQGSAILAGDALFTLAIDMVLRSSRDRGREGAALLLETTQRLIWGQAEDASFESRKRVSSQEVIAMCAGKTAALLACSCELGALLAGASSSLRSTLRDFGFHLGIAFQAVDDIIGIWGDPEVTGKPVYSDLRNNKKTLPVAAALSSTSGDAAELGNLIDTGLSGDGDLQRAAGLIEAAGGREWTNSLAEGEMELALQAIRSAGVAESVARDLEEVAMFVTLRSF